MTINRKNTATLGVLVAAAVAIFAGIRLATPSSRTASTSPARTSASPDNRPSPVAESVDVVVRTRKAPDPGQPPAAAVQAASKSAAEYNSTDTSRDWSVVAATLNSVENAEKRARDLKSTWSGCGCSVFPKSDSERYFVVVGTGLDRNSADRLRDQATASGLPGDTYVTKLIRRPGDSQP